MPTPNEIKIAAILKDHKRHIANTSAAHCKLEERTTDVEARLEAMEANSATKPIAVLPLRWIIGIWTTLGVALVLVITLFALLLGARSDLHALRARMDSRRMATDADIQAMIDAQPAAEVAAALAPVKRRKRIAEIQAAAGAPAASSAPAPAAVPPSSDVPGGQQ